MSWLLSCVGCGVKKLPENEETKILDFQHFTLTSVPPYVFECERVLEELYLDFNQISELPKEIFHCHELQILSLSDNDLHNLPSAICSLNNLIVLDLSKNGISDIPDNIKSCKRLKKVNVSTNPLCRLPEGFTQLVALKELCLSDTFLDYLPANFGRLVGLEVLELRENQLNTLPRSMTRLKSLKRLDLGQNEFSEMPEVVGHLTSLTDLWIDNNRIKCLPPEIGNLSHLTFIDASKNRLQEIDSAIGSCQNLTDIFLTNNDLECLPDSLSNCIKMNTLHIDDNRLDYLPQNIGAFDQLIELKCSHNELESLPQSIGLMRSLQFLHVDDNLLTSVPIELGSCASLLVMTFAHNEITELPPEMGNLTKLKVLNICGNLIKNLPVSFTKLQLTALWLSTNQAKPLVSLQCTFDETGNQKVLTCFMLPQVAQNSPILERKDTDYSLTEEEIEARRAKSVIHFASDGDVEPRSRLSRIPTPYPKELRALAKHTRNIEAIKKNLPKETDNTQAVEDTSLEPVQGDASHSEIKLAATITSESAVKPTNDNQSAVNPTSDNQSAFIDSSTSKEFSEPPLTTSRSFEATIEVNRSQPPSATRPFSGCVEDNMSQPPNTISPFSGSKEEKTNLEHLSNKSVRNEDELLLDSAYSSGKTSESTAVDDHISSPDSYKDEEDSSLLPTCQLPRSFQSQDGNAASTYTPVFESSFSSNYKKVQNNYESHRPASLAMPESSSSLLRPGSLALDSAFMNQKPRPGSIAVPINTVGIPSSSQTLRALSQSALCEFSSTQNYDDSIDKLRDLSKGFDMNTSLGSNNIDDSNSVENTQNSPDKIFEQFVEVSYDKEPTVSVNSSKNDKNRMYQSNLSRIPTKGAATGDIKVNQGKEIHSRIATLSNIKVPTSPNPIVSLSNMKLPTSPNPMLPLSNMKVVSSSISKVEGSAAIKAPSSVTVQEGISPTTSKIKPPSQTTPYTAAAASKIAKSSFVPTAVGSSKKEDQQIKRKGSSSSSIKASPHKTNIPSSSINVKYNNSQIENSAQTPYPKASDNIPAQKLSNYPQNTSLMEKLSQNYPTNNEDNFGIPMSPVEKPINQTGIPILAPNEPTSRIPTFSNSSLRGKKSGIPSPSAPTSGIPHQRPTKHQVSPTHRAQGKAWTGNN